MAEFLKIENQDGVEVYVPLFFTGDLSVRVSRWIDSPLFGPSIFVIETAPFAEILGFFRTADEAFDALDELKANRAKVPGESWTLADLKQAAGRSYDETDTTVSAIEYCT